MAGIKINSTCISKKISAEVNLKPHPFFNSVIRGKRAFMKARLQEIRVTKEKNAAI